LLNIYIALSDVVWKFDVLNKQAEERLTNAIKDIIEAGEDMQNDILGFTISNEQENLESLLEEIYSEINIAQFFPELADSYDMFLGLMRKK